MTPLRFKRRATENRPSRTRVTLGIDFGTSQTKVMFRQFDGDASIIVPPGRGADLCWPSTVVLRDGRFGFAEEPASDSDAKAFRWIKMLLAEPEDSDACRSMEQQCGCSPHCLAALYLAYVMRNARERIVGHLGPCDFTYNLSAPLADKSDIARGQRFDQALYWASGLADLAHQEWLCDDAIAAYESVKQAHPTAPDPTVRDTFLFPEVHAAVAGLIRNNALEDGHYAVVDIGAGTTDVSVFLFRRGIQDFDAFVNGQNAYFAAGVLPVASNEADKAIARTVREAAPALALDDEEVFALIRGSKERSEDGTIEVGDDVKLSEEEVAAAAASVCERMHAHYRRVWGEAYYMEKKAENWSELTVIMLGGGSLFQPFWVTFERKPWDAIQTEIDQIQIVFTEPLMVLRKDKLVPVSDVDFMFTVADGLSYHIARTPKAWEPPEIDPMVETERTYEPLMRNDKDYD